MLLGSRTSKRLRLAIAKAALMLLASCSLATSWDGLTEGGQPDAGADGGDAGVGCVAGGYYCGGDKVPGDAGWLYRCESDGSATLLRPCAHGCQVRPGHDDACVCSVGGSYCGNDQVVGDPQSLYRCESDYSATLLQECPGGCTINSGTDDTCQ